MQLIGWTNNVIIISICYLMVVISSQLHHNFVCMFLVQKVSTIKIVLQSNLLISNNMLELV